MEQKYFIQVINGVTVITVAVKYLPRIAVEIKSFYVECYSFYILEHKIIPQ